MVILWVNVIFLCWVSNRTFGRDGVYCMSCHLFLLNLWLSVTIGHVQSYAWLFIDSNILPPWIDLVSSSSMNQSNWFQSGNLTKSSLIPYSSKIFRLWCSSLHLPHRRCWKALPIIFWKIWLVRPRYHAKYARTLYPYMPGGFNYSGHRTVLRD